MYIRSVTIRNFRMHLDSTISLDRATTVIVGRNNSGKTAVADLFRRFFVEARTGSSRPSFALDDFSLCRHGELLNAAQSGAQGIAQRIEPPSIEMEFEVSYAGSLQDIAAISPFIVDLDDDCKSVKLLLRYGRRKDTQGESFYSDLPEGSADAFDELERRIPETFSVSLESVDPNDPGNRGDRNLSEFEKLFLLGIVDAARPMEGEQRRESHTLGKVLADLFDASRSAEEMSDATVEIEKGVLEAQRIINRTFREHMKGAVLPPLESLDYPLLSDGVLLTRTTFDTRKILSGDTRLYYLLGGSSADDEIRPLPEGHNGLGLRNLLYILLQLHALHEIRKKARVPPLLCMLFLEEPEAHLHPQLEDIFVSKVQEVHRALCGDSEKWPLQIVITTHSSHIANEVPFSQLRYFLRSVGQRSGELRTNVKDMAAFSADEETKSWLTQYLTLTRCDLFFADKALLIEGAAERILLPAFLRKLDRMKDAIDVPPLKVQYLTVVEVGGAYAHRFYDLLDFIGVPALVVTDLDSVDAEGKKCSVSKGKMTSNACIKHWFNGAEWTSLIHVDEGIKVRKAGIPRRIAYQVPETEGGPCARTFEDALILANPWHWSRPNGMVGATDLEAWADEQAHKKSKTEFALDLIQLVESEDFQIPRYLLEGLQWLRKIGVKMPAGRKVEVRNG